MCSRWMVTKIFRFQSGEGRHFDSKPQLGLLIGGDDKQGGVNLVGVTPGSGAQKAGLVAGDRVIEINGKPLKGLKGKQAVDRLVAEIKDLEDGDLVNLVYERDGNTVKTEVAATSSKSNMWSFLGELGNIDVDMDFDVEFIDDLVIGPFHQSELELSDIDAVMGHYFGVTKGVLVIADSRNENGFLPGDIIRSVDGNDVDSTEEAFQQLAKNGDDLRKVKVLRKGRKKTLDITGIEKSHNFSHSSFSWSGDHQPRENTKVIVRRIGGHSSGNDKATRIVIDKKVIEAD